MSLPHLRTVFALIALSASWVSSVPCRGQYSLENVQVPPPLPVPSGQTGVPMRELPAAPPVAKQAEPSPAQNRVSYIPEMRPISQISIDVNSKAKAGNTARPETTQAIPTSEFPAIPAAAAYELQHPIPALGQRTDASFAHKPLYFEEVNLERYGRSWGAIQPAISTTRFFATVPLLPYKLTAYPPHKEYYVDWPYEAGRCAPPVREALPFKPRAALVEAGVLTGAFFVIP